MGIIRGTILSGVNIRPTPPPTTPGQVYGGGLYVGTISYGGATYYLIVSPVATDQSKIYTFGPSGGFTSSDNDGYANTIQMNSSYPAAWFCRTLNANGYTDWYLPAKNELNLCYVNLKSSFQPTDYWSSTAFGDNNAVIKYFSDGTETFNTRAGASRTRAVRRIPV